MKLNKRQIRRLVLFFQLFIVIQLDIYGQTTSASLTMDGRTDNEIVVNRLFQTDGESYALDAMSSISSLAISGTIRFTDEKGYARIVLRDSFNNEYLVFEAYAWLYDDKVVVIDKVCDETKLLDNTIPRTLSIELQQASVELSKISLIRGKLVKSLSQQREKIKNAQVLDKINSINKQLKKQGKKWVAGETSMSRLSYAEKKKLYCDKIPNFFGFEYYCGGVFEIPGTIYKSDQTSSTVDKYVDNFDWRNRHGANWVTPVRDNYLCSSCWAFATVGATELLVNQYYNRHLDLDLSEQEAVSCSGAGNCNGGSPGQTLNYIIMNGIVDESCFPYVAEDLPCSNKCVQPSELIKIGGKTDLNYHFEDTLKNLIIQGAVSSGVYSWNHAMMLLGYKKIKLGDTFYIKNMLENAPSSWITIEEGDSLIGMTAWLFKNSWGTSWGDSGFVYVVANISDIGWTYALQGPITSLNYSDEDIACTDKDGDGYYAWGIGSKPSHCPACPDTADGDDSNPTLGPMDEFGFCRRLSGYDGITRSPFIPPMIPCVYQNYPNPFNPSTILSYQLSVTSNVSVKIFDILGREIATLVNVVEGAGPHTVTWNAQVATGVYFYRLDATSVKDPSKRFTETKKMLLLR